MGLLTINKSLLPLKVHYFFKYGGISFFTLLPVVAVQKGVAASGVALMWTVTPLLSCLINLVTSSLADAFKIHRGMFLAGNVVLSASFISIFLLPDAPSSSSSSSNPNSTILCLREPSVSPLPSPSPAPEYKESIWWVLQRCLEGEVEGWSQGGEQGNEVCNLVCELVSERIAFYIPPGTNNTLATWGNDNGDFYDLCNLDNEYGLSPTTSSFNNFIWDTKVCTWAAKKVHCKMESCGVLASTPAAPTLLSEVLRAPALWAVLVLLVLVYGGNSTTTTMADTVCFSLLGSGQRHHYGRQRLWGSLGWGLVGLVSGVLVDLYSTPTDDPAHAHTSNYTPALLVAAAFLTLNFGAALKIPFKARDKEKLKAGRVGRALCSCRGLVYLMTVVVGGVNMGLVWTFLFLHLEKVAVVWDPHFSHLKLLEGLMLSVSCFLGEVPSFFLSPMVIQRVGNIWTFVAALLGYSVRVLLYASLTNPWLFLPVELMQGLSFGLFYPNMTSYASRLAPPGAAATVQGIVKSLFIVGVSLGSLVGGVLMTQVKGSLTFQYLGYFDVCYTLLFGLLHLLLARLSPEEEQGPPLRPPGATLSVGLGVGEQASICDVSVVTPCVLQEQQQQQEQEQEQEHLQQQE